MSFVYKTLVPKVLKLEKQINYDIVIMHIGFQTLIIPFSTSEDRGSRSIFK